MPIKDQPRPPRSRQVGNIAGLEKKSRVLNDKEKKIVAYHEVGHALVGYSMPSSGRRVEKISIVPRGMAALGYTLQLPTEDRFLMDEAELRGQIATLLGGRSAEEIVFGSITTGASNDLPEKWVKAPWLQPGFIFSNDALIYIVEGVINHFTGPVVERLTHLDN